MSIDCHVHPWTASFMKKNPPIMKACDFFKIGLSELPQTTEQLLSEMDEAAVEKAVILGQDTHATKNPSFRAYTMKNEEVAKIAARSGDRLIPFAGVDPNSGESLKELRRGVKELRMRGLKIHSSANSVYPNDRRRMFPLYEFCQDQGLPIVFHTGTTGLGDCEIGYSKPEFLDEVCQAFPDLKVVMAHFGWPWTEVALAVALRNPNVFIDISGWKPRYLPQVLLPYMNGILQDRFLFGTDYPMIRHPAWKEDFDANFKAKLKPQAAEKLLRGNARRLLG
jgi:uncharacterized protein